MRPGPQAGGGEGGEAYRLFPRIGSIDSNGLPIRRERAMPGPDLFLHEELMLLTLKDREGTVAGGDLLLDEWLNSIATEKKLRGLDYWVTQIAGTKELKHRIATGLCRRGILRTAEDKVLLIFNRKVYPELDPAPERRLMDRLESAIFRHGGVDPRTAVLIGIANNGGILQAVFEKSRLKGRKDRIKEISGGAATVDATKEAIQAVQTAVMVATIIPAVMASTIVTT